MVPLTQLEVAGLRPRLDDALTALQELRLAEVVTIVDPGETPPDLADLIARTDAMLELVDQSATGTVLSDAALRTTLDHLERQVAKLLAEEEELRGEAEALPRSIAALDGLQSLVPELGRLPRLRTHNQKITSAARAQADR